MSEERSSQKEQTAILPLIFSTIIAVVTVAGILRLAFNHVYDMLNDHTERIVKLETNERDHKYYSELESRITTVEVEQEFERSNWKVRKE